jgi:type III secretion system YscQ/HrcQ family protein
VDISLTSYLLSRITSSVQERTGLSAQGSSLLTASAVAELLDQKQGPWGTAQLELTMGDHRYEIWALWDMAEASPRPQEASAWTGDILFPVSVCAGRLRLAADDLRVIDPGDTLVPDQWYADMWVDPQDQRLGPVELRLQSWSRRAQLLFEKGFFRLEVEGDWHRAPQGGFMETEATPSDVDLDQAEEQDSTASFRLSDELELLLAFELERITVPLKELSSWSEGTTITLQKTPEDPVAIVLRQAGQERLLGHGRVVVVEDRLGIQIEKWLVDKETQTDPGGSSGGD